MGLRINTNTGTLTALRTLKVNDRNQVTSLERLSTGLRINRASDDPAGLVISELLRGQLSALKQAVENTENSTGLVSVADAALEKVSDLLVSMKESLVFAMNSGSISSEQLQAEQDSMDAAVNAIDRIAATTRYGSKNLLNGSVEFVTTGTLPDQLDDIRVRTVVFPQGSTTRTLTVTTRATPERGSIVLTSVSAAQDTTIRISGPRGTADIRIADGAIASGIARAVNSVAAFTGVYASGSVAATGRVGFFTEEFGTGNIVRVEIVEGMVSGSSLINGVTTTGPFSAGSVFFDTGANGSIDFNGQRYIGVGREFTVLSTDANFTFRLDPELIPIASGTNLSFSVANTGFRFQINERGLPTDSLQVGIMGITASQLGRSVTDDIIGRAILGGRTPASGAVVTTGGFLNSLITGGTNSLSNNPQNATNIVEAGIRQVSSVRAFLGAVIKDILQPNFDALNVHIQELTKAESTIRDLDFAEETSKFLRTQVVFQANLSVMASANQIPQSVLGLLR